MKLPETNMVGRLGLVFYWLGCLVAAVLVSISAYQLSSHEPGNAGVAIGFAVVAWTTGRAIRYTLKGD